MQAICRLLSFLLIVTLLISTYGCQGGFPVLGADAAPTHQNLSEDAINHSLKKQALYSDTSHYRKVFFEYYNDAIAQKNYEAAKDIVAAYGCVTDGLYDTVYIAAATQFVNKNYPVTIDSQYAMICHFAGWKFFLDGNYQNTIYWAKKALESCTFPNASKTKSYACTDLAAAYVNTNKTDSAITWFLAAKTMDEANKDTIALAVDNFNIGSCYYALYAFTECAKYVNESARLYLQKGDTSNYLQTAAFIPLEAEVFALDTATLLKQIDLITAGYQQLHTANVQDTFYLHILLAQKALIFKQYEVAASHLEICENISRNLVNPVLTTYLEIFVPQYEMARFGSLKDEAAVQQTAKELLQAGSLFSAADAYQTLAKNAEHKGNLKAALHYRTQERSLRDSIQKSNIKGQLFELEKKYQSEKKEQQIALQQETILSRNTAIALLAISIAGLVMLGVVLQYRQRQKKLTQEKQNTLHYTRQLLQKTEDERKRIASDLHDSISHELLSLKTAVRTADTSVVNDKVDTIINDIRIISRNLHPVLFDKIGLQLSIEQMVERIQQQNNFMLTADIAYQAGTLPPSSELQVYRMVQEAVTNIIRYSAAIAGKISILQTATTVLAEVKDNGKGFPVEETLNSGKAFGLYNIVERSRAIGGEAKIESGAGGTIITIRIPKP